jgi:general secretion pathway protein A
MLKKTPFSLSPNPNSMYMTDSLKAVVNRSKFAIDARMGLTAILGDVGLGKSTILRFLYNDYAAREDDAVTCVLPSPEYPSHFALLRAICVFFALPTKRSLHEQLDVFQNFLLDQDEADKIVVVFIDEAQKLTFKMLELIRSMLNFEKPEYKLVQIVLAGQLELRDRLLDKKNKALYSRVFAPSLLSPLTQQETHAMVIHRCTFAEIKNPFPDASLSRMYELTGGVPRDILSLCAMK